MCISALSSLPVNSEYLHVEKWQVVLQQEMSWSVILQHIILHASHSLYLELTKEPHPSQLTSNSYGLIVLAWRSMKCLSIHKLKPTGKALWISNGRSLSLWSINSNFPVSSMANNLLPSTRPGNLTEMNDWQVWLGASLVAVPHQHVRAAHPVLFLKCLIDERRFQGSFKGPSKTLI